MTKMTINLTPIEVTSRGVSVTVDVGAIDKELIVRAIEHGVRQTVADAASSAAKDAYLSEHPDADASKIGVRDEPVQAWLAANEKTVQDVTQALMQKRVDSLLSGEWSMRGTGEGNPPWWGKLRAIVTDWVKNEDRPKWDSMDGAAKNAARDAFIESLPEDKRAKFEEVAKQRYEADQKELAERKAADAELAALLD